MDRWVNGQENTKEQLSEAKQDLPRRRDDVNRQQQQNKGNTSHIGNAHSPGFRDLFFWSVPVAADADSRFCSCVSCIAHVVCRWSQCCVDSGKEKEN